MHKNNKMLHLKVDFLLEKKKKAIQFKQGRNFVLTCLMAQHIRQCGKPVIVHKTLNTKAQLGKG